MPGAVAEFFCFSSAEESHGALPPVVWGTSD